MVVSIYDVAAYGDDPLLPDEVRVGGWLSVVCDTFVCGAGVARIDRGDTEVVAGPGVVRPDWVDGLICADGSLRPEPPPMHAMFCVVCYWLLPVNQDMTIATMYSTGVQIVACMSGTCSCHYLFNCLV